MIGRWNDQGLPLRFRDHDGEYRRGRYRGRQGGTVILIEDTREVFRAIHAERLHPADLLRVMAAMPEALVHGLLDQAGVTM